MTTEANKVLIRRLFHEVVNNGSLHAMDEILSPGFVSHEALPPGIPPGREGAKLLFDMLRNAFPDLQASIEHEIAEADKVVVRVRFSGTHQGEFMGIAPTNRPVSYTVTDIFRITAGKVTEHWGIADSMGLMQQLKGEALEMSTDKY